MKKYYLIVIFLVSSLFSQTYTSFLSVNQSGDRPKDLPGAWVDGSMGVGLLGISGGLDLNLSPDGDRIYRFSIFGDTEFVILGQQTEGVVSFSFMEGHRMKRRWSRSDAGFGAGLVFGYHKGDIIGESPNWPHYTTYETDRFSTVGIVGSYKVIFKPVPFLGIGFQIYGCLNPEQPTVAVHFMLQVGD
ncbi:MAG: hypothetical protein HQ510_12940 [Candidatus Marinimicrobia bacterium]|nr:hypothetical protein [Candidatus Neomarinimicrobiota bacterium]